MVKTIDLHCDTIVKAHRLKAPLRDNDLQVSLNKLRQGGALAQCFAMYIAKRFETEPSQTGDPMMDRYETILSSFRREMAQNSDIVKQALTVQDILDNDKNGLISAILTMEEGAIVGNDLRRLDRFHADGVRIFGFTWNYENTLGYPNSIDSEVMSKGLKPLGIEAVEKLNKLGIAIDVSHLNDGGFYDVARYSKKPFFATHSNARSLCDLTRNLPDDQLRILGETGSVTGLNFCDVFMRKKSPDEARMLPIADIVWHARYIVDKAGEDALAFGSDFEGIDNDLEFKDASGMQLVVQALSRHFTSSQLEKICYKNALRVLKEVQNV